MPAGFANLGNLSNPALLNALTQLDGEDATGAQKGAFQLMTQFLDLMLDPNAGGGAGSGSGASGFADEQQANLPPDVALAYARALHKPPPQHETSISAGTPGARRFGGSGTYDGNAAVGSTNVTASDYGYAGGMDYHLTPDTVYGFALGGGGTNWNLATSTGQREGATASRPASTPRPIGARPICRARSALPITGSPPTASRWAISSPPPSKGQSYAARGEAGYRCALPVPGYIIGVTPYAWRCRCKTSTRRATARPI